MKGYTTKLEIENYLLTNIDPTFNSQVNSWIEQMESYIDQKTNRSFVADTQDSIRLYSGDNTSTLLIDDCVSISEILNDGELLVSADYVLYPGNTTPKNKIKLVSGVFYRGDLNVSVKAKWGYATVVPADIKFAATVLVAGIINYSADVAGEVKSMSLGGYSVTYKDEKQWQDFDRVSEILKLNKKFEII